MIFSIASCTLLFVALGIDASIVVGTVASKQHALSTPLPHVVDVSGRFFSHYTTPSKRHSVTPDWVVVFYATWCTTCDELAAPVGSVARDHSSSALKFMKVDVSADHGPADRLGVEGFPAVVYVRRGRVVSTFEGARTESNLRRWVSSVARD